MVDKLPFTSAATRYISTSTNLSTLVSLFGQQLGIVLVTW